MEDFFSIPNVLIVLLLGPSMGVVRYLHLSIIVAATRLVAFSSTNLRRLTPRLFSVVWFRFLLD